MRADIKAFAINAAPRKTVIFALQKSNKQLSLLIAFRQDAVSNQIVAYRENELQGWTAT